MDKVIAPEEQFALLTEGFSELLKGVMLMPVSDELKSRVLGLIAETMTNLVRLTKMMIKDEMGEALQGTLKVKKRW